MKHQFPWRYHESPRSQEVIDVLCHLKGLLSNMKSLSYGQIAIERLADKIANARNYVSRVMKYQRKECAAIILSSIYLYP